jgi:hypothetical protein
MNMRHSPVGRITVESAEKWRWGRLRDGLRVAVPLTVTFTPEKQRDGPTCVIEVDEHSGSLVVTGVTLTGSAEHPIGSDAVRVYSLQKLAAIGAHESAMPFTGWDAFEEGETWPPTNKRTMESIVAATRSRVSPDRERLEEVARVHEAGGVRAVEKVLHVSRSQAYRLIKLAREAGYIEEES